MKCQKPLRAVAISLQLSVLLAISDCAVVEGIGNEIVSVSNGLVGLVGLVTEHGVDLAAAALNASEGAKTAPTAPHSSASGTS